MDIAQMHVWFRQYAQQMGMQNVRAILPEQIDLVINTSITDVVNQIIKENIAVTNDRVITDNSKIGQINALSTLYKVLIVSATPKDASSTDSTKPFNKGAESYIQRIFAKIKDLNGNGNFDYLYLTDLAINYSKDTSITNYFPIRLIDDSFLADTLNDFVLAPRVRTPIAVIYNNQLDLYIDVVQGGKLPQGLVPNELRLSYIAKPAKVAFMQDLTGNLADNVDCDLPEFLHVDILKHAVDLWRIAVSGALQTQQQGEQAQQQENARNNYRNDSGQQ